MAFGFWVRRRLLWFSLLCSWSSLTSRFACLPVLSALIANRVISIFLLEQDQKQLDPGSPPYSLAGYPIDCNWLSLVAGPHQTSCPIIFRLSFYKPFLSRTLHPHHLSRHKRVYSSASIFCNLAIPLATNKMSEIPKKQTQTAP